MAIIDTSAASSTGIPPNIAQLTGPIIFGSLMDYLLFGVLTLQVYIYHYSFPDDRRSIKILVWSLYVLELVQVCCAGFDIYFWLGSGYGNLQRLNEVTVSAFDTPILGSLVAFIVQLFFCYRIWELRKSDWYIIVCVLIAAVSVVQLVGGILGGVTAFIGKYVTAVHANDKIYGYLWLVGEAVADILIAVTMTYLLLGSSTELSTQSRSIILRIVRLIVQTNTLTASVALVSLVVFLAFPHSNSFIATTLVLGKLYSNTFLATFNHRLFLRKPQQSLAVAVSTDYEAFPAGKHSQSHP